MKTERSEHNKLRTQFIFFMEQYEKDKKKLSRALSQKRLNAEAAQEIDDQAAAE